MNDFDYDVLQKKRLAKNAQARKCGSKSRKCSLPSDYLTHSQWKERNGAIMSINLNRPVPWKEFKTLPASLQEEYVKHLADAYGCNAVGMSMVFGANASAVRAYFSRHGLSAHSRRGEQMPYESVKALESFINQGKSADCPEDKDEMDLPVEHEPECKEDAPFTPAQQQEGMRMTSFTIRFNGTVDAGMIANSLRHILGDNARGEIEVQCRLEKEGTND